VANVLVVEDESAMWRALENTLKRRGHKLVWRSTAERAITYLKRESMGFEPELGAVLLDLELAPGMMTGLDVSGKIRPDIVTIVSSGHAEAQVRLRVERPLANARVYLQKPYDMQKLFTILERVDVEVAERKERKMQPR
jgi:DNA-binding NtrC family response regulator